MKAEPSTRSRTPEPPWLWMSKAATRRIRTRLDGDTLQVFALAVYHALCENASDKGTESFQTLQSHIGSLAGDISTRTVQRCLPILREIGLIHYETPKLSGNSDETLFELSINTAPPASIAAKMLLTERKARQEAERHAKIEGKLEELKTPHWSVVPTFWATVAGALFAALAAWFSWLALKH